MEPAIICVDMDAFFASVEQRMNPSLRGRPIGVIGSGGRTVITTASYEARELGVKTGMNVWEARSACPQLVLVVGNNARYTWTCMELEKVYSRFTPDLEIYSVDEAFLDVTATHHLFGGPMRIGSEIKKAVREGFGIDCTVGIGPNVLIAKLASDLGKPDGLLRVMEKDVRRVIERLPVDELWGIGKKTARRLEALGIRTCGELGRAPASLLRSRFGIRGESLKAMGMGICARPVEREEPETKSVGHSMTLPRDISERGEIRAHLLRLSEKVGRRARRHGLMGRKVTLAVRYSDFETFSRQRTLPVRTNDTHVIYQNALGILDGLRLREKVRLLGVTLSSLAGDAGQMPLIKEERRRRALLEAMDSVNEKHGDFTLAWGAHILRERAGDVISPAWRPSGVRHVKLR
jgi:DNA polymerase-4